MHGDFVNEFQCHDSFISEILLSDLSSWLFISFLRGDTLSFSKVGYPQNKPGSPQCSTVWDFLSALNHKWNLSYYETLVSGTKSLEILGKLPPGHVSIKH